MFGDSADASATVQRPCQWSNSVIVCNRFLIRTIKVSIQQSFTSFNVDVGYVRKTAQHSVHRWIDRRPILFAQIVIALVIVLRVDRTRFIRIVRHHWLFNWNDRWSWTVCECVCVLNERHWETKATNAKRTTIGMVKVKTANVKSTWLQSNSRAENMLIM